MCHWLLASVMLGDVWVCGMLTLNVRENHPICTLLAFVRRVSFLNPQLLFILLLHFLQYDDKCTIFRDCHLMCVCFFRRLEDASLANCKLQQSLKIKEEKITELETKYALIWLCLPVNREPGRAERSPMFASCQPSSWAQIFVRGHYLFREAKGFWRRYLEEICEL